MVSLPPSSAIDRTNHSNAFQTLNSLLLRKTVELGGGGGCTMEQKAEKKTFWLNRNTVQGEKTDVKWEIA